MGKYGYAQAWNESVSAVTATPSTNLLERREDSGYEYVYVYNGGTTQISPGFGAIASANSAGTVLVSSVTGDVYVGVVKNATLTTGTYGWLLTRGVSKVEVGNTVIGDHTAATGVPIALMSAGKFYGLVSGSAGTGTTWSAFDQAGYTLTSIATATSGTAYIKTGW